MRKRFGAMAVFACVIALAACGSGGDDVESTIPQDAGAEILAQLDQIEAEVEAGECEAAQATADELNTRIESLPEDDVSGELRETLLTASGRLQEQTRDPEQCEEPELPPPPTGATGETGVLEEDEG